jgi:hypothetical protein
MRYFCINANHVDVETGEKEPDLEQEVIIEDYDKKLKY